jgi:hypothetical protein
MLERDIFRELTKKLVEVHERESAFVLSGVLPQDDYALHVGKVHAVQEIEGFLSQLRDTIFPDDPNVKQ